MESVVYSEENDTDTNEQQKSPKKQTPHRKRLKHKYNAIRQQMEFYFGDANLSKDRFLKQLIDKDPYVPLDVFLTFNKLKLLTTSVEEIAKSLSNSQLLEIDSTKQKVCRKTALPADRNVDNKTLYVEALPPTATHDWVRKIFEKFGPVTYVSLPKYASRKLKEFGFIEFEQEVSVEKAVRSFKEFNGVLSMEETDPAELQSVTSFVKEQKQNEQQHEKKEQQACKKRDFKKVDNGETASDEPKMKKNKMEQEENSPPAEETGDSGKGSEEDDKRTQSSSSSTSGEELNNEEPLSEKADKAEVDVGEDKTKRRKRKKKSHKAKKHQEVPGPEPSYYDLKILPKRDWKKLRNKYLNLQRERIAEMKRKAFQERQQSQRHPKDSAEQTNDETAGGLAAAKQAKPNEQKFHNMNMNFYGAGREDEPQAKKQKHNVALERTPRFTFEAGIIIEVGFLEPCVNLKEFKEEMRQYPKVKYIDVKEGSMAAHLRLETPLAADEFIRQISCAEYRCKILTGDAETDYWKKIERDREMKLNKQVRVPQKRGREKIKKTLSKHIRFGDEDEDK